MRALWDGFPAAALVDRYALVLGEFHRCPRAEGSLERRAAVGGLEGVLAAAREGKPPAFIESMFHLHKVDDDLGELSSLTGALDDGGILAVMVPSPLTRRLTEAAGGGGAARQYGLDALARFRAGMLPFQAMQVLGRDPVTGEENLVYLFAKSAAPLQEAALALAPPAFHLFTEEGVVLSELPRAESLKAPVNAPCILCGSRSSMYFGHRGYRNYRYPGAFQMRRCRGCGLLFNSPRLNAEDYQDLYKKGYYFFDRSDREEFLRVAEICRRTVSVLPPESVPERRLLEIGSAKGYLLALLKRMGWAVSGVEISPDAAEYARTRFGVDAFAGTVEEYAGRHTGARFPVVLATDLIEHIADLDVFMEAVGKLLAPGGLLVLDTPNAAAEAVRLRGMDARCFNPFHIFLFSPQTLPRLLEKHGFRVETLFTYGNGLSGGAGGAVPRPDQGASLERVMDLCAESLKAFPYSSLPDAGGPLAASQEGLNMVAVARRG